MSHISQKTDQGFPVTELVRENGSSLVPFPKITTSSFSTIRKFNNFYYETKQYDTEQKEIPFQNDLKEKF